MKLMLFSLRSVNEKTVISILLTGFVTSLPHEKFIRIKFPDEPEIKLNRWEYTNKMKVYDDGKRFFIVGKGMDSKFAFAFLLNYSISKVERRIDNLITFRNRLKLEVAV